MCNLEGISNQIPLNLSGPYSGLLTQILQEISCNWWPNTSFSLDVITRGHLKLWPLLNKFSWLDGHIS